MLYHAKYISMHRKLIWKKNVLKNMEANLMWYSENLKNKPQGNVKRKEQVK